MIENFYKHSWLEVLVITAYDQNRVLSLGLAYFRTYNGYHVREKKKGIENSLNQNSGEMKKLHQCIWNPCTYKQGNYWRPDIYWEFNVHTYKYWVPVLVGLFNTFNLFVYLSQTGPEIVHFRSIPLDPNWPLNKFLICLLVRL